jgi:hypothetical protein
MRGGGGGADMPSSIIPPIYFMDGEKCPSSRSKKKENHDKVIDES